MLLISSTPNISSSNRGDDGRFLLEADDLSFFCNSSGGDLSVEVLLLLSVDFILVVYTAVQWEDIEVTMKGAVYDMFDKIVMSFDVCAVSFYTFRLI